MQTGAEMSPAPAALGLGVDGLGWRDVVSNLRNAPLEVIAIARPAAVVLTGASMSAKPSASPKAYQSPRSSQPASLRIWLTAFSRFSGLFTSPAQTSGL